MTSSLARHRAATPSPRAFVAAAAARAIWSIATVPVGALAGCTLAAMSSSADRPELGLVGLAVGGLPLAVHSWRSRLTAPGHGRRSARRGAPLVEQQAPAAPPACLDTVLVEPLASRTAVPAPAPAPAGAPPMTRRQAEIAELHRIWNSGTGPDTGPMAALRGLSALPAARVPLDDAPATVIEAAAHAADDASAATPAS